MANSLKILLMCCVFTFSQGIHAASPPGYVIEWGWNTGDGTPAPATLVLSNTVAISAGRIQCLAVKSDGTVNAWGWSRNGQITFDNIVQSSVVGTDGRTFLTTRTITNGVLKINGQSLNNVNSVSIGSEFAIGLKRNGTVIGWGKDSVPIGPSNVVAIAAASYTSLAVKKDGTIMQWTGHGPIDQVPGLSNVVAIAIGESPQGTRSLALEKDGTVAHWGEETIYKDATPPAGLSNVVAVGAGYNHSLALKNDGTIVGWGFNEVGQATGVPTTNAPYISTGLVTIEGRILNDVVSVAASHGYSMALRRGGAIVTWGRMVNGLYPANVPAGLSNVVAIAAGESYCLAITTNSAVAEHFQQK